MKFTGERVIEGDTPRRIWLDHIARYEFASTYVRGKLVLDIACGTGYGSKILWDGGAAKVFGVDVSTEAINFALNKYKNERLEFRAGDIGSIDFAANYFDVVVCFETIEHVKNQERALSELLRVLKPDGLLIISSPNREVTSPSKSLREPPNSPYHVMEYSSKEFISALKSRAKIIEIRGQRPKNKLLFLPVLGEALRFLLPSLYNPEIGEPELERVRPFKEYRYIIVVGKKLEAE